MDEYNKYIGLDPHKDTIAVAVAEAGRQPAQFFGEIPNTSRQSANWLESVEQLPAELA